MVFLLKDLFLVQRSDLNSFNTGGRYCYEHIRKKFWYRWMLSCFESTFWRRRSRIKGIFGIDICLVKTELYLYCIRKKTNMDAAGKVISNPF